MFFFLFVLSSSDVVQSRILFPASFQPLRPHFFYTAESSSVLSSMVFSTFVSSSRITVSSLGPMASSAEVFVNSSVEQTSKGCCCYIGNEKRGRSIMMNAKQNQAWFKAFLEKSLSCYVFFVCVSFNHWNNLLQMKEDEMWPVAVWPKHYVSRFIE